MNIYIYTADLYCKQCGEALQEFLIYKGLAQRDYESSYNSDQFPKGPYPDSGGESDSPQHCAAEDGCINAIELSDGTEIGVWLENGLTEEGVEYVREAIRAGGEVAELWADFYSDQLGE